jgi:hypothetical protein
MRPGGVVRPVPRGSGVGGGDGRRSQAFIRTALVATGLLLGAARPLPADPLVVTPQLSVSEEYNDNIFFTEDAEDDFITSITPGLTVQYQQPRFTAFLSATTSAQLFARHTSENDWANTQSGVLTTSYRATPRLAFTLSDLVSRVRATRTGTLPLAEAPPAGPGGAPPPAEPPPSFEASTLLPRGEALSNVLTVQSSYALTRRWTGALMYSNGLSSFSDPSGRNLSNTGGLQATYKWTPELVVNGGYSYTRFTLTDAADTDNHTVTLGGAYTVAQSWSVNAIAGLYVNQPVQSGADEGTGVADSVGPVFSVTLAKTFEHASVLAGVSQGVTTSAGVSGVSQTTAVFLQYQQQFTQNLSGGVRANYSHFDADPSFNVAVANVGLTYALWRSISVGLSYSYQWSDANESGANETGSGAIDSNLVLLSVTASYPLFRGDL